MNLLTYSPEMIDHTSFKPEASRAQLEKICIDIRETMTAMVEAGATRIGTSNGVAIMGVAGSVKGDY